MIVPIGGLGFMANVVINYLTSQPREPVNGCVLLAPLCHSGDISGLTAGSALDLAGLEYAVHGSTGGGPVGSTLPGSDFGECKAVVFNCLLDVTLQLTCLFT